MASPSSPVANSSNCARCGGYCSSFALRIGDQGFCQACAQTFENWPYPSWLKLTLAALILLLVVALAHGRTYFHAGRVLYVGERLLQQHRPADALPYLKEASTLAPRSDKAVLLTAKAALLVGDMQAANTAFQGHDSGHFDDANKPEFLEAKALWDRAEAALNKAGRASKLAEQDGNEVAAARLMHEAASTYPEMKSLAVAAEAYDGGVAFTQKDYDGFLRISQDIYEKQPHAFSAAGLASAFACKFAVTGNPEFRQHSEEMMAKARELIQKDPEETKSLAEYEERIKHRLDTRQIITKTEYDRRFRAGKSAAQ